MRRYPCAVLLVVCLAAARSSAQEVAAVLSSESGAYGSALKGLQEALGRPAAVVVAGREETKLPPAARVVVSFGAKAALRRYPEDAVLIYAMTPGIDPEAVPAARKIRVSMSPNPKQLLEALRRLRPGLHRLGVFWESEYYDEYVKDLRGAAAPLGVEIVDERLSDNEELPDRLRDAYGRADAIYALPDPLLLNTATFGMMKNFALDGGLPLVAPTAGLAADGAPVSVGVSFREIGRAAAKAALAVLRGSAPAGVVYPERIEVVVNKAAARAAGLEIPEGALREADRVLP